MVVQITHVFREANKIADSLANLAVQDHNNCFFQPCNAPKNISYFLQLDKLEVPFVPDLRCSGGVLLILLILYLDISLFY